MNEKEVNEKIYLRNYKEIYRNPFMKNLIQKIGGFRALAFYLLAGALAMSCANRGGGPQGGPKDETPPIPLNSKPENGARNFNKQRIEISFDEIVLIEKAYEKVVVSPPQNKAHTAKAYGKKVVVELADSLRPNCTYIVDFADAIVDNNEKNPLKDYYFTFSTGATIDSLMIGGTVVDARTLNPVEGLVVGLHTNHADTAFTALPFDHIAKTDKEGRFWLKGLPEGRYKIYALGDQNNNYRYDQPTETAAFLDSIIVPNIDFTEEFDTIWRDSATIDTVIAHLHPKYTNGVVLRSFTADFQRQNFIKAARTAQHSLTLYFTAPVDSLPKIEPLNFAIDSCLLQQNATRDTLTYWFPDTLVWQPDTLSYVLTYQHTDSLDQLSWQTDTLNTIFRHKKATDDKKSSRRKKDDENKQKKTEFLKVNINASNTFDLYNPVRLTFDVPTVFDTTAQLLVEQRVDTLWQSVDAPLCRADSLGMCYEIRYAWQPEKSYRITADSAAFVGLTGLHTNKIEATLKVKSLESYATFYLIFPNLQGNEIVELLDKSENVVRTLPAKPETVFEYLNPGDYFLRLFVDENANGRWDTGAYAEQRQPEAVYYFPYKLAMRAFWDIEETWDYNALPLTQQKPKELIEAAAKKKK